MRTIKSLILFFLVLTIGHSVNAQTFILSDGWQVQSSAKVKATGAILSTPQADTTGWYPAMVPSTLMGVLTTCGAEPKALTAADYQRIDRQRFNDSWWYHTTFTLPPSTLHPSPSTLLSFDGISYRANVWLNGHQIATSEEMAGPFRQFTIDVTPYVRQQNVLAVEVFRAQPGEPNIGFVDWNPRPADESMGIFREVTVKCCGAVSVAHTAVHSKVNTTTLDEAWLTISTFLTNHSDQPVEGTLIGTIEGRQFKTPVTLAPHERRMVQLVSDAPIQHPRLWWCHNMGKPELYNLHVEFQEDDRLSDFEDIRFGIRQIESFLTPEGYRAFKLNGRNVLLRGAGWTDDIYLRDTPATNRLQLEYVRHMNMNTVRFEGFWGTSQNLYDLCDELGLLALVGWSCHWEWEEYLGSPCPEPYGGIISPEQIEVVAHSFEEQVLWLRHHPSIIAWFVGSDRLPKPELEQQYRQFLTACDDRCYIISAKQMTSTLSGSSGTKMAGPYEYVGPAYWYHPQAPGGAFGFNTETGIGAQLPVKESLTKMLRQELSLPDQRWDILCTASTSQMNTPAVLTQSINQRFGTQKDIDHYLQRADLLNYESTRAMFEAFRVNAPRATGIIQWMLNSARPSIYWQLYDYYKQPNAAYYAVRRANAPVQLIYDYQRRAVFAVNETLQPVTLTATLHLQPSTFNHPPSTLHLQPSTITKVFDVPQPTAEGEFLFLQATDTDGREIAANEYFLPRGEDSYDWEQSDWWGTPISQYASYRMLNHLQQVTCQGSVRQSASDPSRYEMTLTNPSESVAFFIRLTAKDDKGELLCSAFWSDNYVTLAPHQQRTIICTLPDHSDTPVQFALEGWNVKAQPISTVNYDVVPMPQNIQQQNGDPFALNDEVQILTTDVLQREAVFLQTYIHEAVGLQLPVSTKRQKKIRYIELSTSPKVAEPEGYVLTVTDRSVSITGGSAAGVFYGIQTLRKSLNPPLSTFNPQPSTFHLPPVRITDFPRFPYRGMHLDCSRHFFTIDFIKKYIDLLALHNMNVVHWHLSDDQGWRIEIKKWPLLTTIGSQRSGTIIGTNSDLDDHIPYGGYYTQDEARSIVEYARERHITVIPEIDMPGHMLAALASYPELGCTGGPYQVGHYWGVYQDVLCVGNPKVYEFVEDVLTEIMDIFPSEIIHIGGDETPTEKWEHCAKCQALHPEGTTLQGYFTQRVFDFLTAHHRRALGWDEILDGCPADAIIMSWRGSEPGAQAAALGHDVIMAPTTHCYFDYQQTDDPLFEPSRCGGCIHVEKVYSLEPVPDGISADARRHILGVQANLWTEYITNEELAEYQALPRMSALAEVQWTQPERKNYSAFRDRLTRLTVLFDRLHYTYAKHLWPERTLPNRWQF